MSNRVVRAALVALLLLAPLPGPGSLRAEEESDALVTRIFDVGALLAGRPEFLRVRVGPETESGDEETPLFGAESEEPVFPLGQIEELIEQIRSWVRPETWDATLGGFLAAHGERYLVVRAFPDVVDAVATFLGELERRTGRLVAIDVESFRLEPAELAALRPGSTDGALDPAVLAALRTGPRAGPAASLVAFERAAVTLFVGRHRTFVAGYNALVAKGARAHDPYLRVDSTGLALRVRLTLDEAGARGLLDLDLGLAEREALRVVEQAPGGPLQLPRHHAAGTRARIPLALGAPILVDGQAGTGWSFVVRARALGTPAAVPARGLELVSPPERPARKFAERRFDVADLQEVVASQAGTAIHLMPSNYTPPEAPELPEPSPIWGGEALVQLLRCSVMPATWDLSGTSAEVGYGWLRVRNVPAALDAIGQNLELLRRELLGAVTTEVHFVEVPRALAEALAEAPDRLLDEQGSQALTAALGRGEATVRSVARVSCLAGARNATVSGDQIAYVADQEVSIAEGAFANHPVVGRILSGASVDLRALADASRTHAHSVLRLARSEVAPLETVETALGPIETPDLSLLRVETLLRAPLGRTVLVAVAGSGPTREIVLAVSRR